MADVHKALAALRPDERARLDRFASAFERVDASAYMQLTDRPDEEDVRAAQDAAIERIGTGARRDAVRSAIEAFIDAASVAYSRRASLTDTFLLNQSLPDSGADRARFLAGVERAVVGLILWEQLDDEHLATLIGRWASFVEDEEPVRD